ncbi:MAG: S-adenosyl-l-methionine hydroxide adenosyltransferase family protein [Candidatus Hydrogenedentota bacterium]
MKTRIVFAVLLVMGMLSPLAGADPNGIVALVTDYGADSVYAGVLQGVIYDHFPDATVVSVTHSVPAFDIVAGAHVVAEAAEMFPSGTVFCAVVDPGVGGERRSIAVRTDNGSYLVGPDNGLLALAAEKLGFTEIRELTNGLYWRQNPPSSTFHGRDIYGPVAGHLAGGALFADLGPIVDSLRELDFDEPEVEDDAIHGQVLRVDAYGNVITTITREHLREIGAQPRSDVSLAIEFNGESLEVPFGQTYSDVEIGEPVALVQSMGFLELAINQGHFDEAHDVSAWDPVVVRVQEQRSDSPFEVERGDGETEETEDTEPPSGFPWIE